MSFENQSFTEQTIQPSVQKQSSKFVIILIVIIVLAGTYLDYSVYTSNQSTNTDNFEVLEPISKESAIEESDSSSQMQDSDISSALDSDIDNKSEQQYTMSQVAENNKKNSCWTIINGSVYNITSYIPTHPGGESEILQICGKDGSQLFAKPQQHKTGGADRILSGFKIGYL
jgi:cytochrome b involved in lipid metabolism